MSLSSYTAFLFLFLVYLIGTSVAFPLLSALWHRILSKQINNLKGRDWNSSAGLFPHLSFRSHPILSWGFSGEQSYTELHKCGAVKVEGWTLLLLFRACFLETPASSPQLALRSPLPWGRAAGFSIFWIELQTRPCLGSNTILNFAL